MIVFPSCKINLNLTVVQKRADGYHDLDSIFYPLPSLTDALEMLPDEKVSLTVTGTVVPGDPSTNLCLKAYALLKADFTAVQPVLIHLHKRIPVGAGLGGGSADGTASLQLLNQLFSLGLTTMQLLPYASRLGSDCAYFLYDGPCMVRGRGDVITPLESPLDLSPYQMILVNPGIHVDTSWAFGQLDASDKPKTKVTVLPNDVREWKKHLVNDFEVPVFKRYPEIEHIKDTLYAGGATYAAMSGSGSTVFGLFPKDQNPQWAFPSTYWTHQAPL
jgi:4-diphosphocytidyl-2-C-methyl-D-erythritol kinase